MDGGNTTSKRRTRPFWIATEQRSGRDEVHGKHPHLRLRLEDAPVGPAVHALLRDELQLAARVCVHQPTVSFPHNVVLQGAPLR